MTGKLLVANQRKRLSQPQVRLGLLSQKIRKWARVIRVDVAQAAVVAVVIAAASLRAVRLAAADPRQASCVPEMCWRSDTFI